jgi:hypothetical protein
MWQLLLHLTFVVSALLLAVTDRISTQGSSAAHASRREKSGEDGADPITSLVDRGKPA